MTSVDSQTGPVHFRWPTDTIRAELLTLRVTRTPYLAALALLAVSGLAGLNGAKGGGHAFGVAAAFTGMVCYCLGVLGAAADFQHGTATLTYLTRPRRGEVLLAKAVTYLGVGALAGLVFPAVAMGVGVALGGDLGGQTGRAYLLGIPAIAVATCLGLGVGTLLRQPVRALAISAGWFFVVDGMIGRLGLLVPFGGFAQALAGPDVLGFASLCAWTALVLVVADRVALRRDIAG